MDLQSQIVSKQVIGQLGPEPVFELETVGGLCLVVVQGAKNRKTVVLGAGPHRAVARHIARQKSPELVITELRKSDSWLPLNAFASILDDYRAITDQFNE